MTKRAKKIRRPVKYKECPYCKASKEPYFMEVDKLGEFVSLQGKILPRTVTGLCAKHQRRVTKEIKRARILALMPFTQPKTIISK